MLAKATRNANQFQNRARSITGRQSTVVNLSNPGVPNRAEPATTVDVPITVRNDATVISPTDPEYCNPGALFIAGLSVEVQLQVNGETVDSAAACVAGLGGSKTFDLSWVTESYQEPTTVEVELVAKGQSSGQVYDRITRSVEVTSAAPSGGGNGGNNGGACGTLRDVFTKPGCSITDFLPISTLLTGAAGVLFLLVLLSLSV